MTNYNTATMNAQLFVKGSYWELSMGEWQYETDHISLGEVAQYFHEDIEVIREEKVSEITLHTSSYIDKSSMSGEDAFNEVKLTAEELKNLYKTDGGKQHTELLSGKIIWLILVVPCSDTEQNYLDIPVSLNNFFSLMWKQYHHPEVVIEDIPF